jgi:hypothetical protein
MVTALLPAVTVTGKAAADADAGAELAADEVDGLDGLDELLLADEPQPARAAAQAAAPSTAASLRGVLIAGYFLPGWRERKARPLARLGPRTAASP